MPAPAPAPAPGARPAVQDPFQPEGSLPKSGPKFDYVDKILALVWTPKQGSKTS